MSFHTPCPVPDELVTGGHITAHFNSITVHFDDIKYALSTGALNGGFHHVLAVRNQHLGFYVNTEKELPGGSMSSYLASEFEQIDTPVHFSTALITAATMEHHIYTKIHEGDCIVEAIVTAGVDKTAHRAGGGYLYAEHDGLFESIQTSTQPPQRTGTINILLFTNKALGDAAMVKALLTITEAKAAALADLNIPSVYPLYVPQAPSAAATGTSTDGVILTINPQGDLITDVGTFSRFGDTLAKAVYQSVYQAILHSH